jgi:hypothetical protein
LIDVHFTFDGLAFTPFEDPPDWRGSSQRLFGMVDDVFTRWRNDQLEQVGPKNQKLDQKLKILNIIRLSTV